MFRRCLSIICLFLVLLVVITIPAAAQDVPPMIFIYGDSDSVTFKVALVPGLVLPDPFYINWAVDGQLAQFVQLKFTTDTVTLTPPPGTIGLFFGYPEFYVETNLTRLSADGFFALPQADHTITVTGSQAKITLTSNFDIDQPLLVFWSRHDTTFMAAKVTLINRHAELKPPPLGNEVIFVKLQGVKVNTDFSPLGNDGWYMLPPPPASIFRFPFLPIILR